MTSLRVPYWDRYICILPTSVRNQPQLFTLLLLCLIFLHVLIFVPHLYACIIAFMNAPSVPKFAKTFMRKTATTRVCGTTLRRSANQVTVRVRMQTRLPLGLGLGLMLAPPPPPPRPPSHAQTHAHDIHAHMTLARPMTHGHTRTLHVHYQRCMQNVIELPTKANALRLAPGTIGSAGQVRVRLKVRFKIRVRVKIRVSVKIRVRV